MTFSSWLFGGAIDANAAPHDPRWGYTRNSVTQTGSGVAFTPDGALSQSAVLGCTRLIAGGLAMMPLGVREIIDEDETRLAREHRLTWTLCHEPNRWQTPFEFFQMLGIQLCLRGNAYAEKIPGARGFVDQLIPIHPDLIEVDRDAVGSPLRYRVRQASLRAGQVFGVGPTRELFHDEIVHLRDLSVDGMKGLSRIQLMGEGIGVALAARQEHASFYGNGSRPSGHLSTDVRIAKADDRAVIREEWEAIHQGPYRSQRVAVLDQGLKYTQIGVSPADAAYIDAQKWGVNEVARAYGVPPHMIGDMERSTSWGSGLEQQSKAFVTYTLGPWMEIVRQGIARACFLPSERIRYFLDYDESPLVRGDVQQQRAAESVDFQNGVLNQDEIRRQRGLNPKPSGSGRTYYRPANLVPEGQELQAIPQPNSATPPANGKNGDIHVS